MSKLSRHAVIRDLLSDREVGSQDELRRILFRRGHHVTQATLSRDIHELGLVKTALNQVIIKTSAGSAQPVSAAIDAEEWEEVVGTIGGDDTILAIAPDSRTAIKLAQRLRKHFA